MDVKYCGDHFIIYTNIESLCCTPDVICQLYTKIIQCYMSIILQLFKSVKKRYG